ncbi:DUF2815 family protein [Salmonella enterica subsp. enterica serovar Newport]
MAEKLVPAKKVKNGVLYKSGHIKISNVRASYPHLDKPYGGEDGGEPKYSLTLLMPKSTHGEIEKVIREQIEVTKKNHKTGPLKVAPSMLFIKDGDTDFPDKPECEGMWVISARERKRPDVYNIEREELTTSSEILEEIYGGCWVSVVIRPWSQENKFGKRVNANLISVLKRKDDEPFGEGRVDTSDAWDDDEDWEEDEV